MRPVPPEPLSESLHAAGVERHRHYAERAVERGLEPIPLEALPGDAARVWAVSGFVARSCTADPGLLHDLVESGDLARDYAPASAGDNLVRGHFAGRLDGALGAEPDEAALRSMLRRHRRREWVRLAWRDIGGLGGLEEMVRDASAYADAALSIGLAHLHRLERERLGEPCSTSGEPQHLVVLALGKLGAHELNFSSDIDLIFTFPRPGETRGGRRTVSNDEFFLALGRRFVRLMSDATEDGYVFRVDMRLRPFGASGPLAVCFDALEHYYQTHGRDWERYALIRARPVAGDIEAGERLLERLRPFVYRRYLDFGTLESLRDMKRMMVEEIRRRGLDHNVKLGSGGIREIEFTGQAFQMVRGGRIAELRDRSILRVLATLAERGLLPAYAVDDLTSAYRFLRDVEHRLQQREDHQVHELPDDEDGRRTLAAAMGYATWEALETDLAQARAKVSAQFTQVFGAVDEHGPAPAETDPLATLASGRLEDEPAAALMASAGFADGTAAWERLHRFLESYTVRVLDGRGRGRLERLLPDLVRAIGGQPAAEVTLARVLGVLESIARRSVYLALLCERPLALSQLVRLCAASPWIARQIGRHPLLLDELLDPRTLQSPLDRLALQADIRDRLGAATAGDTEQEMELLRQFKHANVLRVAAADVGKAMPLMVVSDHLTEIAETVLGAALELAWRDVAARHGEPRCGEGESRHVVPFAVVGYGKLGGIELGYGSDLDLVFVHGSEGARQHTDGPREVDNQVFFGRLAQRIIHFLATLTPEGQLYEVDPRLRPSGSKGLIANSLESTERYLVEEAWTWEHQALVRARAVAGDRDLMERFAAMRRRVLLRPREPGKLRTDVREMRERMRRTLGTGTKPGFDLKQDAGGIADIEFMVQYAALRWAGELGDYLDYTDNIRLLEGIGKAGLMEPRDVRVLTNAYRTYRARVHTKDLQEDPGPVGDDEFAHERAEVLRIWHALMEA